MNGTAIPLPERKSLGGISAAVRLSPDFLLGIADLDVSEHIVEPHGLRAHRLEPVRTLLDEVMVRFAPTSVVASDQWLGPRLHATLRLSRREAGNREIWRFLGLWAADYVRWRFGPPIGERTPEKAAQVERFLGPDSKQALARLWWMSETFRNGKDYSTASLALTNQDIVNNLFRMSISNHRPTALAALAVLPRSEDGTSLPDGRLANALAKATNVAASTLLIDMVGPDHPIDGAARSQWESVRDDHDPQLYFTDLPEGPDDGEPPAEAVARMTTLLSELLAEAPVRGRPSQV